MLNPLEFDRQERVKVVARSLRLLDEWAERFPPETELNGEGLKQWRMLQQKRRFLQEELEKAASPKIGG